MKKQSKESTVKTTVDLPAPLWKAAKIRAIEDETDLRQVLIVALQAYLKRGKE